MPLVNSKPFYRSFRCAGVLWIGFCLLIALTVGIPAPNFGYFLGRSLVPWLLSGLITGGWARVSRRRWSELRYWLTIGGLGLLILLLMAIGRG